MKRFWHLTCCMFGRHEWLAWSEADFYSRQENLTMIAVCRHCRKWR